MPSLGQRIEDGVEFKETVCEHTRVVRVHQLRGPYGGVTLRLGQFPLLAQVPLCDDGRQLPLVWHMLDGMRRQFNHWASVALPTGTTVHSTDVEDPDSPYPHRKVQVWEFKPSTQHWNARGTVLLTEEDFDALLRALARLWQRLTPILTDWFKGQPDLVNPPLAYAPEPTPLEVEAAAALVGKVIT